MVFAGRGELILFPSPSHGHPISNAGKTHLEQVRKTLIINGEPIYFGSGSKQFLKERETIIDQKRLKGCINQMQL